MRILGQMVFYGPLGYLTVAVLAVAMASYADWSFRQGGARRLWRQWVLVAVLLDIAVLAAANGFLYERPRLQGVWAPLAVSMTAISTQLLNRWRGPRSVRLGATSLVFAFFQLLPPLGYE